MYHNHYRSTMRTNYHHLPFSTDEHSAEPILVKDLTTSYRRKSYDDIMLLTEKNNGYVKGRAMFNGKQSHVWTTREDICSPTADNEGIMITVEIDAKEGIDLMGVYIQHIY